MGGINKHHKPSPKNGTAWVRHTHTIVIADDKHTRKDLLACQNIIISFSIPFLSKNACKKNPCKNNATCQTGFTDRDYQCLCVDGSGFKGHDCDEGKESYTFISIANHMISSEIWGKSARVYFERPIKLYEPVRTHMLRWFNSLIILFRGIAVYFHSRFWKPDF